MKVKSFIAAMIAAVLIPMGMSAQCNPQALPYTEDFDNLTSLSSCFRTQNATLSSTYSVAQGGKSVKLTTGSTGAYIVLPAIAANANAMECVFQIRNTSTASASYYGGIVSDTSDIGSFSPVYSGTIAGSSNWEEVEFNTSNYLGTDSPTFFIIYIADGATADVYVDNINIHAIPLCPRPQNFAVTSTTASDVTFGWTAGGTESQWSLTYSIEQSGTTVASSTITVSQPTYTVTGLASSSAFTYTASIRALCSATDSSAVRTASGSFSTSCVIVSTFPYTEDFEGGTFPATCQNAFNPYNQQYSTIYYSITSNKYHSSSHSLYAPDGAEGNMPSLALPQMNLNDPHGYTVKFWMYRHNNYPTWKPDEGFKIYISAVNNTLQGATELGFIPAGYSLAPAEAQAGWYQYSVDIPTSFNGLYYVIVTYVNGYNQPGYIDDITVDLAPGCRGITATSSNITATSADIVATDTTATAWLIYYGENSSSATGTTVVANSPRFTLTGLTPNTQYGYYVSRICGTDTSEWSSIQLFRTLEVADTLPFYTDFEDSSDDARWTMTTPGYSNFFIGDDANAVYAGSRAMYVSYDNYTYGYNQNQSSQAYASRLFHFEEGDYTISFRYKCTGGERSTDSVTIYDFGRIFLVPGTTTLTGGTSWNTYASLTWPAGIIPLEPSYHAYYCKETGDVNGWNLGSFDVHITGGNNYKLAFFWNNDGSGGDYYPLAIDELSIRTLTCARPEPVVSMLASSSANISMSGANSYQLVVSSQPISLNDSVVTGDIMDTVFTTGSMALTGLTANTTYYYTARAFCSATDISEWSEPAEFTTECIANVPYSESFEQAAVLGCWTSATESILTRSAQQAHAGINSLYINNDLAVSPELDVTSMASYVLNGWIYSDTADVLYVGVMVDPTDAATIEVLIDSVSIPARVWTEFTADFTLLNDPDYSDFAAARHFVLSTQNRNPFYADQLYFAMPTTCQRPVNTVITDTVHNGFQMTWTDNTASQWAVRITELSNQAVHTYIVDTTYVNVADLNEQTLYSVEVAAICNAGDTSVYTSCGNVRTPIYVPTCPDPASAPEVNSTTASTMTVTANGNYTDYQFAYGTSTDLTSATVLPVQTAAKAVITGLSAQTSYNVWFRGVCEPGDTSRWSAMASGTTTYNDFFMPQNLHVVGTATATSTTIAWGAAPEADKYEFELVNDSTGETTIDTVVFTNLAPATTYTFRVRGIKTSPADTTAWAMITFKTIATPAQTPYFCDFEDVAENDNWTFENGSQANYFMVGTATDFGAATNALFVSGNGTSNTYVNTPSTVYALRTLSLNAGKFRYSYNWVCAGEPGWNVGSAYDYPRIFLAPASMQFTAGTVAEGIGYGFNDIPAGCLALDSGTHLTQALSTRTVKGTLDIAEAGYYNIVVFWTNDNSTMYDPTITVDSIRFAQLINGDHYTDTICYGEPYTQHGFNVASSDLYAGVNNLSRIATGAIGCPDTLITAAVIMRAMNRVVINDTICEGDTYNKHGFVFTTTPVSGQYTHRDISVDGCDSTTYLNLEVIATSSKLYESICKGDTYYWHGVAYNAAGTYSYVGTGARGCPVNDTLYLSVIDGDVSYNEQICNGGSYYFIDTLITTAGTYSRRFFDSSIGCYVTYTVNVSVVRSKSETYNDVACEGHPYTGYGFSIAAITKDTTLSTTVPSVEGCDSTTTVYLTFVPTVTSEFDDTIPESGVYYWGGKTLTEPGEYPYTYMSVVTGCDSVVTLHLHANTPTDVENIANVRVELVPNPVNSGETAMVYGNFGEVSSVEILNNFGQIVDRFVPTTYPIEVSGISGAGIYYVRVMTTAGNVYVEKLIVR